MSPTRRHPSLTRLELEICRLAVILALLACYSGGLRNGLADVDRVWALVGDLAVDVAFPWESAGEVDGAVGGSGEVGGQEVAGSITQTTGTG